jgi:hypothetical protein
VKEVYDNFKQQRQPLEDIWELSYDAFLGRYSQSNLAKWKALEGHDWRSKVFIRFARRKVLSSVSQINDIQFQAGQMPFNITPADSPKGQFPLPEQMIAERALNMKQKISGFLQLQKYDHALMASNLEAAIYGMSVHKAPVVRQRKDLSYQFRPPLVASWLPAPVQLMLASKFGRHVPVESMMNIPLVEHVNLWDYFWDLEATEYEPGLADIQRVMMDSGMVRRLEDMPGYDKSAINQALSAYQDTITQGADSSESPGRQRLEWRRRGIEVVEFRGRVPVDKLGDHKDRILAQTEASQRGKEREIITVIAFVAGGKNQTEPGIEIYPAQPNPFPLQARGFHKAYWEVLPHEKQGVGICENVQDSQIMQNGFWRAFIDSAALSSNLVRFYKSGAFKPGQDMNMRPGAGYELEDWVRSVSDAVTWVSPPFIGGQMIEALNTAERIGDEESGVPRMMQGERSKQAPKTAFESSQLLESANKQQGQIIKNIDEGHIEPDVTAIYHYLMMTDPNEAIKGQFEIQATGFAAFNDKMRKGMAVQQLFGMFMGSDRTAFLVKVDANMRELYKLRDLDPDQFMLSEKEIQQEKEQAMQMAAQAGIAPPPGQEQAMQMAAQAGIAPPPGQEPIGPPPSQNPMIPGGPPNG